MATFPRINANNPVTALPFMAPTWNYQPANIVQQQGAVAEAPAAPPQPQAPVNGEQMMAMFQQMLNAQQQQGTARQGAAREASGGIRRDAGGMPIDQTGAGFFGGPVTALSPEARQAKIQNHWNNLGYTPLSPGQVPQRNDQASNPYAMGPLGPGTPESYTMPETPLGMSRVPVAGGGAELVGRGRLPSGEMTGGIPFGQMSPPQPLTQTEGLGRGRIFDETGDRTQAYRKSNPGNMRMRKGSTFSAGMGIG